MSIMVRGCWLIILHIFNRTTRSKSILRYPKGELIEKQPFTWQTLTVHRISRQESIVSKIRAKSLLLPIRELWGFKRIHQCNRWNYGKHSTALNSTGNHRRWFMIRMQWLTVIMLHICPGAIAISSEFWRYQLLFISLAMKNYYQQFCSREKQGRAKYKIELTGWGYCLLLSIVYQVEFSGRNRRALRQRLEILTCRVYSGVSRFYWTSFSCRCHFLHGTRFRCRDFRAVKSKL